VEKVTTTRIEECRKTKRWRNFNNNQRTKRQTKTKGNKQTITKVFNKSGGEEQWINDHLGCFCQKVMQGSGCHMITSKIRTICSKV